MTQVAMYLKGVFIAVSLFIAFSTTRLLHWFTCCGARGWERARRTESSRRGRWHLSGQTRSGDGVRERECGTYLLLVILLVLQNDLDALLDDVAHFVPDERDLCTRKKKVQRGRQSAKGTLRWSARLATIIVASLRFAAPPSRVPRFPRKRLVTGRSRASVRLAYLLVVCVFHVCFGLKNRVLCREALVTPGKVQKVRPFVKVARARVQCAPPPAPSASACPSQF